VINNLRLLLEQVSPDTKNNNMLSPHNKQKKWPEMEAPAQEDTTPVGSRTTV